jgi:hypothetical protein
MLLIQLFDLLAYNRSVRRRNPRRCTLESDVLLHEAHRIRDRGERWTMDVPGDPKRVRRSSFILGPLCQGQLITRSPACGIDLLTEIRDSRSPRLTACNSRPGLNTTSRGRLTMTDSPHSMSLPAASPPWQSIIRHLSRTPNGARRPLGEHKFVDSNTMRHKPVTAQLAVTDLHDDLGPAWLRGLSCAPKHDRNPQCPIELRKRDELCRLVCLVEGWSRRSR